MHILDFPLQRFMPINSKGVRCYKRDSTLEECKVYKRRKRERVKRRKRERVKRRKRERE